MFAKKKALLEFVVACRVDCVITLDIVKLVLLTFNSQKKITATQEVLYTLEQCSNCYVDLVSSNAQCTYVHKDRCTTLDIFA